MNLKNKVLSGLLAVVACSSFLNIAAFAANESTFKLTGSANEFNPGDEITLTFSVDGNPGIIQLYADLVWDDSVTMTSVTDTKVLPGAALSKTYTSPYKLNWGDDTAEDNITTNGDCAKLVFKVADDAVAGSKHSIKVTCDTDNTMNFDFDSVKFAASSFDYTIASASKPATAIKLDKTELTLDLNGDKTGKITATVEPTDTTDKVAWDSKDKTIATVDENGNVTAVAEGKTTITATIGALDPVACTVTVKDTTPPEKPIVDVTPSKITGDYGTKTLKYIAKIVKNADATAFIKVTKTLNGKTESKETTQTIAELLGGVATEGTLVSADVAIGVLTADTDAVFSFGLVK